METKKLKGKLHEIETRDCTASEYSSDHTDKVPAESSNKPGSIARKRTRYTDLYDDVEAKFSVMERAEKVLARLENELPHFMKCMLPSNVAHGFWLVHIVRVNDSDVVGAALCLMEMDASRRGTNAGSEITNQPQSKDLCYPKTSFLHDHSREGVICR
ncbi:UNVERIFIED_CONTAM: hypothetical protein Slati_3287100 [Sesamum latifolium]|uniref:Uncharacterized protein n=1 Tax=Sesamum latifolium TaxID=2727402 RepID=A0AAW2V240_9LAMI